MSMNIKVFHSLDVPCTLLRLLSLDRLAKVKVKVKKLRRTERRKNCIRMYHDDLLSDFLLAWVQFVQFRIQLHFFSLSLLSSLSFFSAPSETATNECHWIRKSKRHSRYSSERKVQKGEKKKWRGRRWESQMFRRAVEGYKNNRIVTVAERERREKSFSRSAPTQWERQKSHFNRLVSQGEIIALQSVQSSWKVIVDENQFIFLF